MTGIKMGALPRRATAQANNDSSAAAAGSNPSSNAQLASAAGAESYSPYEDDGAVAGGYGSIRPDNSIDTPSIRWQKHLKDDGTSVINVQSPKYKASLQINANAIGILLPAFQKIWESGPYHTVNNVTFYLPKPDAIENILYIKIMLIVMLNEYPLDYEVLRFTIAFIKALLVEHDTIGADAMRHVDGLLKRKDIQNFDYESPKFSEAELAIIQTNETFIQTINCVAFGESLDSSNSWRAVLNAMLKLDLTPLKSLFTTFCEIWNLAPHQQVDLYGRTRQCSVLFKMMLAEMLANYQICDPTARTMAIQYLRDHLIKKWGVKTAQIDAFLTNHNIHIFDHTQLAFTDDERFIAQSDAVLAKAINNFRSQARSKIQQLGVSSGSSSSGSPGLRARPQEMDDGAEAGGSSPQKSRQFTIS